VSRSAGKPISEIIALSGVSYSEFANSAASRGSIRIGSGMGAYAHCDQFEPISISVRPAASTVVALRLWAVGLVTAPQLAGRTQFKHGAHVG
jgi:hypothetical protein